MASWIPAHGRKSAQRRRELNDAADKAATREAKAGLEEVTVIGKRCTTS